MTDFTDTLDPVERLTRDLVVASRVLSLREARFLVDTYYQMQDARIRAAHQTRLLAQSEEPNTVMSWLQGQNTVLEKQVGRALDAFSGSHPVGQWARSIVGVGPVISAGLIAYLDIHKAPSVGHFWRIAGLDPTSKWGKGEIRPWNATLKTLCYLIGESFVKFQNHPDDTYGKVYATRKSIEIERNDQGLFAEQCNTSLTTKNYDKSTEAWAWYSACLPGGACAQINALPAEKRPAAFKRMKGQPGSGTPMLPPARIQLRSARYATKLFLSHLHHVWYEIEFGKPPPMPYILNQPGHVHFMGPPNWPMVS
jgi:hypothetical protein